MLDQEEEWIRAWSDLYELAGERHDVVYLTPEFEEMARKEALSITSPAGSAAAGCPGETTREMEQCLRVEGDRAAARLERYADEVVRLFSGHSRWEKAFTTSQATWRAYAQAECQAVYVHWEEGSLRNVQLLGCRIQLTEERTWQLWSTYLRGMETELPEPPSPARCRSVEGGG